MNNIINRLEFGLWLTFYVFLCAIFITIVIFVIAAIKRKKKQSLEEYDLAFLEIKLPSDNEIEIKVAENMFSNLFGFQKGFWKKLFTGQYRIAFEIVGKQEGIGFYLVVPDSIAALVEKQINAAYPSAEIDIINPHEVWDRGNYTKVAELKLKAPSYYPLRVFEDMNNDSLNSITSSMTKLERDEVLAVQYVIQPSSNKWRKAAKKFTARIKGKASSEKGAGIDTSFTEGVEKKTSHPGFYTKVRIISIADNKVSADSQIQNMKSAFEQFTDINYNSFKQRKVLFPKRLVNNFIFRKINPVDIYIPLFGIPIYTNVNILNTEEMATVFHFPNKDIETPNIKWLGARRSKAPGDLAENGIYLGKSVFRGVDKDIKIEEEDRTRHFYIVGQTGTGKSQLMMWMALQDMRNGEGLAIIDPHGTDVQELLEKVPPERKEDVILFDASDTERPLGLNLLEAKTEEEKHMLINAFIALLYKLYDPNRQGIMGPMLERTVRNVMLTAMSDPAATMVDVLRLIIDDNYYKNFLDKIKDPLVKRFWIDEVANTSQSAKGERMGYFVSKFDRLVTDGTMRRMIGQSKSSFRFDEIMAQKKILLVDLAKGKIGEENSNFIGLLLVPRILAAALSRHKLLQTQGDFPDFYLYVDEFQNFATPDFATILAEARKYKLNLIVAHQFIPQLEDKIKDAIFGNVGSLCSFRVGPEDAEFLEKQFEPVFSKSDLIKLPNGHAYMKLLVHGHPTSPFSMQINWSKIDEANEAASKQTAQEIREFSRQKYGTPAEEIDAFIDSRAGTQKEEKEIEKPSLPRIPF